MIGDTDFFVDLMRQRSAYHARAVAKARELEGRGIRIAMTAVTRFELSSGIEGSVEPAREREKVLRAIGSFPAYPLDGPSGDRAGGIHGERRARGSGIGPADAMIAGIALENREPLVTRNLADFARIEGLVLDTY